MQIYIIFFSYLTNRSIANLFMQPLLRQLRQVKRPGYIYIYIYIYISELIQDDPVVLFRRDPEEVTDDFVRFDFG